MSSLSALLKEVELECGGDISSSQEEVIHRNPYLDNDREDSEVYGTPPEQNSQEQGEEEQDVISMCTLPFTPSPSHSSQEDLGEEEDSDDSTARKEEPGKPRIRTRKVRGFRSITSSPSPRPSPNLKPSPGPARSVEDVKDPLVEAILMMPTGPAPTFDGDILELARAKGIF